VPDEQKKLVRKMKYFLKKTGFGCGSAEFPGVMFVSHIGKRSEAAVSSPRKGKLRQCPTWVGIDL
jgi:hypothetical protein